jgi:hypothetical protein
MKTTNKFLIAACLLNSIAHSQTLNQVPKFSGPTSFVNSNIFSNGTYVGINNTSPLQPLHIITGIPNGSIRLEQTGTSAAGLNLSNIGANGRSWSIWSTGNNTPSGPGNFIIRDFTASLDRFFISGSNGNIGIRTISPYKPLTVNGDVALVSDNASNSFEILGNGTMPSTRGISIDADPQGHFDLFISSNQQNSAFRFKNSANSLELMNLGIDGKMTLTAYSNHALEVKDFVNSNSTSALLYTNGNTHLGKNLQIGFSNSTIQSSNVALNISAPAFGMEGIHIHAPQGAGMVSEVNHTTPGGYNVHLKVKHDQTKALAVENSVGPPKEVFVIWGNGNLNCGKTQIGSSTQLFTGPHGDAMLTVGGTSGKIVAKQMYVTQLNWADYVFDANYSLPDWKETEEYFTKNHHLKDVPTTEDIKNNGNNLGETDAVLLKKIEEAYLYLSKVNKEIEDLKEANKKLQNEVKELKSK